MFNAYPEDGGWIMTFTGKKFYPTNPDSDLINIVDIAHALSNICRYAGHSKFFYSVGQHSILLAEYVKKIGLSKEHQLAALTHDSSEAYLVDIPKPVKHCFKGYAEAEDKVSDAVAQKFGFSPDLFLEVKPYDVSILLDEVAVLYDAPRSVWNVNAEPLGVKIESWTSEFTKQKFLQTYKDIVG